MEETVNTAFEYMKRKNSLRKLLMGVKDPSVIRGKLAYLDAP